jgi:hypothetical protein
MGIHGPEILLSRLGESRLDIIGSGQASTVVDTVEAVTGNPLRTFEHFIRTHIMLFNS